MKNNFFVLALSFLSTVALADTVICQKPDFAIEVAAQMSLSISSDGTPTGEAILKLTTQDSPLVTGMWATITFHRRLTMFLVARLFI